MASMGREKGLRSGIRRMELGWIELLGDKGGIGQGFEDEFGAKEVEGTVRMLYNCLFSPEFFALLREIMAEHRLCHASSIAAS